MLNKIFGKKEKKENYFLQIEEKTAPPVGESSSATEAIETEKTTPPAEESASAAQTAEVPAQEEKGGVKKKAPAASSPQKVTATPVPAYEPPEWVKAIKNYSGTSGQSQSDSSETFATKYLIGNASVSRRRPGPSLNSFKEMASKLSLKK